MKDAVPYASMNRRDSPRQDKEWLSGRTEITNLPDPGALARYPQEMAGSPQHGSLGTGSL